jgi:hypothetical protein
VDVITKDKILAYCLIELRKIAKSQYLIINNEFNLIDTSDWEVLDVKLSHEERVPIAPKIEFNETRKDITIAKFTYEREAGDVFFNITVPLPYLLK